MKQQLQITLSEEATEKYLKLVSAKSIGEVEETCEPSGATIMIDVWINMDSASLKVGENKFEELGDCSVGLVNSEPR